MDIASTVVIPDNPKDPKEIKAAIANMFRQIDDIREQMKADDAEIAQIRAEKVVLKAEAQALGDETRAILSKLRSAF